MNTNDIRNVLADQSNAMQEFGEQEQALQNAILARDWSATDTLIPEMRRLSLEIAALDVRRSALIAAAREEAGLGPDAPFAELVQHAPDSERRELNRLFRSLQVSVLRVKSVTRGIDSYVRGSLRATEETIGAVLPDQKGTLYSKRGNRAPADGRAIVLDRHL